MQNFKLNNFFNPWRFHISDIISKNLKSVSVFIQQNRNEIKFKNILLKSKILTNSINVRSKNEEEEEDL